MFKMIFQLLNNRKKWNNQLKYYSQELKLQIIRDK